MICTVNALVRSQGVLLLSKAELFIIFFFFMNKTVQ